ncbi:hypothetical protein AVEN_164584-1 [Araneus ventricosus]|uniref:Uncharacterized protein n=1 Tax=Araneus ventricosus TaxID=182803 RepID=A0A4Y2B550_ARAVE|nr:hypothetical protein AVEN_164584-1 [Araneus ventricosus]
MQVNIIHIKFSSFSFSSSSICGWFLNCPQDRIFTAKCELQSILYMTEVQGQSVQPFRRNSKRCENPKVSGYFSSDRTRLGLKLVGSKPDSTKDPPCIWTWC